MMPAAYHRVLFRQDDKRHVVFLANRVALVGLALLATAMCGSVLLVTTKLFGAGIGVLTAALVALPFALLWFVAPLLRRDARGDRSPSEPATSSSATPDARARTRIFDE